MTGSIYEAGALYEEKRNYPVPCRSIKGRSPRAENGRRRSRLLTLATRQVPRPGRRETQKQPPFRRSWLLSIGVRVLEVQNRKPELSAIWIPWSSGPLHRQGGNRKSRAQNP